jgi:hypothetical protein
MTSRLLLPLSELVAYHRGANRYGVPRAAEPAASADVGSEPRMPWRYEARKTGLLKAAMKKAGKKSGDSRRKVMEGDT